MKYASLIFFNLIIINLFGQESFMLKTELSPNTNYIIQTTTLNNTTITPISISGKEITASENKKSINNERKTISNYYLKTEDLKQEGDISSTMEFNISSKTKLNINGEIQERNGPKLSDSKYFKKYDSNLKFIFELLKFSEETINKGDKFEFLSSENITLEGFRRWVSIDIKTVCIISNIENNIVNITFQHYGFKENKANIRSTLDILNSNGSGKAVYDLDKKVITDYESNFYTECNYEFKKLEEIFNLNINHKRNIKQTIKLE